MDWITGRVTIIKALIWIARAQWISCVPAKKWTQNALQSKAAARAAA